MSEMMANRPAVFEHFLQFRAVVIQATALAWENEEFADQYKNDPRQAMKDEFSYDCPFDVDIEIAPDNAVWGGVFAGEWETLFQEEIEMILPPKPNDASQESLALANYNINHLTFLS